MKRKEQNIQTEYMIQGLKSKEDSKCILELKKCVRTKAWFEYKKSKLKIEQLI